MNIILDACAVIAFFRDEVGAYIVEDYLSDLNTVCLIHSLNLCEVYYDFWRSGGEEIAGSMIEDLQKMDVIIRNDLMMDFWQQAGKYKAIIRRISLADCFALTLANRENGTLITSDRKEFEPVVSMGICQINFIR